MVPEAPLEQTEVGLAPAGEGWFAVNVGDAAWETNETFGAACFFEGDDAPGVEASAGWTCQVGLGGPAGELRLLLHA